MKLTTANIRSLGYTMTNDKHCVVWDDKLPGFGVRIYPTGSKVYVVSYRVKRTRYIRVIGKCNEMQLREARHKAAQYLGNPAPKGQPVLAEWFTGIYGVSKLHLERALQRTKKALALLEKQRRQQDVIDTLEHTFHSS